MRESLALRPAWLTVFCFELAAVLVATSGVDDSVAITAQLVLVAALLAALSVHGWSSAWGIFGLMVVTSWVLRAIEPPFVVAAPVALTIPPTAVWVFYDRKHREGNAGQPV